MFAIIKAKSEANRDSVCIIDNKAIKKGDDVVLLGNKVKGQRIQEWDNNPSNNNPSNSF
jgi:hypothetical protein